MRQRKGAAEVGEGAEVREERDDVAAITVTQRLNGSLTRPKEDQ